MFPGSAFHEACFLDLSDVFECLGGLQMAGQAPTWLKIATQLVRKLDHQIGYYL